MDNEIRFDSYGKLCSAMRACAQGLKASATNPYSHYVFETNTNTKTVSGPGTITSDWVNGIFNGTREPYHQITLSWGYWHRRGLIF